ncbi:hypothetical protein VJ923_09065 [Adlercreutzia sp. R25]|uniref:hypothetical protein n=1 Tax=Adlercreutzia shanghongiae TaxID=3111773 RepID=UPI002DBD64A6|nr:hypothetical protein [Adlercreutzia sp. R25]MEC4273306.1 hypothetical protein [Adlercreutzia sp. R25]
MENSLRGKIGNKAPDGYRKTYFPNAAQELALAKAINSYLVTQEDDGELRRAVRERFLDVGGMPCYYNITRMVDALVTNSGKAAGENDALLHSREPISASIILRFKEE